MEFAQLRIVVNEALHETRQQISESAKHHLEMTRLKGHAYIIKNAIDTNPQANSIVSLMESIDSDLVGVQVQYNQVLEHLEEISELLNSI